SWPPPARPCSGGGRRVIPAGIPWVAPPQPLHGQPEARKEPMRGEGLPAVLGAARLEPTGAGQHGSERDLIRADEDDRHLRRPVHRSGIRASCARSSFPRSTTRSSACMASRICTISLLNEIFKSGARPTNTTSTPTGGIRSPRR